MNEPLAIDLPSEQRRVLQSIALAGIVGGTIEEVLAYLITRSLDDMLRCGVVKLDTTNG